MFEGVTLERFKRIIPLKIFLTSKCISLYCVFFISSCEQFQPSIFANNPAIHLMCLALFVTLDMQTGGWKMMLWGMLPSKPWKMNTKVFAQSAVHNKKGGHFLSSATRELKCFCCKQPQNIYAQCVRSEVAKQWPISQIQPQRKFWTVSHRSY